MSNHSHEHHHSHEHAHEHNYEHCCDNHTPDNHGCGSCGHDHFEEHKIENRIRIITAALLFVGGYVLQELKLSPDYVYKLCFLVSYMLVGFSVVRNALEGVIKGRIFDENFLMSIASLGAFALGEYSEGVAVMLLFTIGEHVQGTAVARSRRSINNILSQKHETYTLPRHYDNEQSDTEQFITKFARVYTPLVCLISVLIVVIPPLLFSKEWQEWIHRGLAALVVSCPCAIVISIPLCYSGGIGACSKQGIFVKYTSTIDDIAKCDVIIKQGDGKAVQDIKSLQEQGKRVLYAGNGEGDLDMLKTADIPVSLGEYCTNDAVELSDMVIINGDTNILSTVKRISKRTRVLAIENIAFSIAVKTVILILDVILAKEMPMWLAVFGDVGICLIAIANSSRNLRK